MPTRSRAAITTLGFDHSYTGYCHGCGCDICRAANTQAQRAWRTREQRRPRSPEMRDRTRLVPAEPARQALIALMAANPDYPRIRTYSDLAGISAHTAVELLNGVRVNIQAATERAVFAITRDRLRQTAGRVPAILAVQRVRSMQAQGWPLYWQVAQLGLRGKSPQFEKHTEVTQSTFRKVDELYRRVGDQQGTSTKSRTDAARLGWLPGIFYDEDSRLIPEAVPRPCKTRRLISRGERARVICEAMRLSCRGFSITEVSDMVGISDRQIARWRQVVGLSSGGPERTREVLELVETAETAEGPTYDEVAIQLGAMIPLGARDATGEAA